MRTGGRGGSAGANLPNRVADRGGGRGFGRGSRGRAGHAALPGRLRAAAEFNRPDPGRRAALRQNGSFTGARRGDGAVLGEAPGSRSPISIKALARDERLCILHTAKLLPLAFLALDLVMQILEGRQPRTLTLTALISEPLPLDWSAQRERFTTAHEAPSRHHQCACVCGVLFALYGFVCIHCTKRSRVCASLHQHVHTMKQTCAKS